MAKMTVGNGITDYLAQLGNLEFSTSAVIGKSVYQGAKIVADGIREEIKSLPVVPDDSEERRSQRGTKRNPTQTEIDGLLDGLGVAKMRNDSGFHNVKIGMDGYNANVTEKYPKGKPNAMIARSIESGTTFMRKNAFITRAVRKTRKQAENAMQEEVDKQINKIMK
jgi:hypothetical protein